MAYFKDKNDGYYVCDKSIAQSDWIEITKYEYDIANPILVVPPSQVSMRQARLALYNAGLLALVDESISLMPIEEQRVKAQIEWEYATTVQRDSALVYGLAGALGLTDEMLNDLFIKASKL